MLSLGEGRKHPFLWGAQNRLEPPYDGGTRWSSWYKLRKASFLLAVLVYWKVNLCFSFQFLALAFLFLFSLLSVSKCPFVSVFLLVLLFVLNHNTICFDLHHVFLLLLLLFRFCCFGILLFWMLATYQKHLSKNWTFWKPQCEKRRKKRTLWQEQLAPQVCSQIVVCL